ncbi:MAG: DNA polymerase III subunit alpha [Rickettsiales bacterium]|nr:DNA polymerase III subunit alpha [Rickettsiales bacterium]
MFVHLRNYTQYSLSRGALKVREIVEYCLRNNCPAIGISDFGNLFGSMEFSLSCVQSGIQPIISSNIRIEDENYSNCYLLLIASNYLGYKNLSRLVTKSFLKTKNNSFPSISISDLKNNNEGIICLSGGIDGILRKTFEKFGGEKTSKITSILQNIFSENFYLEIQRLDRTNSELRFNDFILNLSNKNKIPLVATNENYFLRQDFYESHEALICISEQTFIDSEHREKVSRNCFLKSPSQMIELFSDIPECCQNTLNLAKKCHILLEEKKIQLPRVVTEQDEDSLLKAQALQALENKLKYDPSKDEHKKEYHERLITELEIIENMGYSGYFLIVADFIQWAKKNKIPVGPGRGSGAGSLVAWVLTITNLDPIKFGLLFERFLNPERVSMPDFDIDFCMEKRDEVIKYVQKKYGVDRVAQIITFGSFQARAALRDVGRVMQLPYDQVDKLCKLIPNNPAQQVSLKDFIKENDNIKDLVTNDKQISKLFKISIDLEGLLRHASTHAAGVVISDKKLVDTLPLYIDPKSEFPVTQFSMKYVEKAGLVKFDFLGLKTLTVISKTLEILAEKSIYLDIDNIPLSDKKTFDLLRSGKTTGVFQFDGKGMKETLTLIKPSKFEDLIAIVSLYRPGPMDNIPLFAKRKNNAEKIEYIHHYLKEILDETYGIMVYQEQVMKIAQKVAGFSLSKADLLRRAMGKKIKSEMEKQKQSFLIGCQDNGIKADKALELYHEIEKFAGYGFNKSHAAAYALVAYQTAFLKAHHPMQFFCASMQCDISNIEKISVYCNEVKNLGFKVYKPDINSSMENFVVNYDDHHKPKGINYALGAIKNIGEVSIKKLVNEREQNGEFISLVNLLKRLDNSILNKRQLESLIYSGSLESIEKNGQFLELSIQQILNLNVSLHESKNILQNTLFENEDFDFQKNKADIKNWDIFTKLKKEHDAIGFYLSSHPLEYCKDFIKNQKFSSLTSIKQEMNHNTKYFFSTIAVINEINKRKSRTGKIYAFFNISDNENEIDAICFEEVLSKIKILPNIGDVCKFCFEVTRNQVQSKLILTQIEIIDVNKNLKNYHLNLFLDATDLNFQNFNKLLLGNIGGESTIQFTTYVDNKKVLLESENKFFINLDFLHTLRNMKGIKKIEKLS